RVVLGREVEAMPVDDALALEHQAHRLEIVEQEIGALSEAGRGARAARGTPPGKSFASHGVSNPLPSQRPGLVDVASPGCVRPRDSVPKKMPSVTPRMASWAPMVPVRARRASAPGTTRYQGFRLILLSAVSSGLSSP